MLFQDAGAYLILYPVGKPSSVPDNATIGSAVFLASVSMRFKSGTATGPHEGILSVSAVTFVNSGGVTFLENSAGVLIDAGGSLQGTMQGSVAVKAESDVGLFAYVQGGVSLANLALLTGATQLHPVRVASVSDYDAAASRTVGLSSSNCSAPPSAAALTVDGCIIRLSLSSLQGLAALRPNAAAASTNDSGSNGG